MTATEQPARPPEFIAPREYRRFVEFCDACRHSGLCYGVPGVGKTASARQYARWDELEAVLGSPPHRHDGIPPPDSGPWRTILYTPGVVNTPRIIERDVGGLWRAVFGLARRAIVGHPDPERGPRPPDLVVVDEADRLKQAGLEQLRDLYDRRHIGLVLIGMPGLRKRLARYAQLYSRVGFVHQFQPLNADGSFRMWSNVNGCSCGWTRRWITAWMLPFSTPSRGSLEGTFGSSNACLPRSIVVLTINSLATVTTDVVDAARESLVVSAL